MKHLFTIFLSALILSFVFTSCKKDEDEEEQNTPTQSNVFKIGSSEYAIENLALINYGADLYPNDDWDYKGYNIDLVFITKGLNWNTSNGYFDISGTGSYLYFEAFSSSESKLSSGTYNFTSAAPYETLTFDYADYNLSFNASDTTFSDSYVEINSGNFVVKEDNNTYEITINCKDEKGNNVSAYYKGSAFFYNEPTDNKNYTSKAMKQK